MVDEEIKMQKYMVYDIGGTSIKWSIITENGDILISNIIKTPDNVEVVPGK